MDNPEEGEGLSRRELLRKGLMAGGSMALFGFTFTSVGSAAASATPGSTASVSLAIAPQWPWGDAVNPVMPAFLSPDPGPVGGGVSSAITVPPGPSDRTGIRAPLLVVPLFVSVDLGHPPISPPFAVHVVATGNVLMADSVQFDVPFLRADGLALGRTQTKGWVGVFPVALAPGSIVLQATIEVPPGATVPGQSALSDPTGSTATLSGDFSQTPLATTLSISDQVTLVYAVGSQDLSSVSQQVVLAAAGSQSLSQSASSSTTFSGSTIQDGFGIQDLFKILSDATVSAKTKLLEIKNRRSAISIGDMFEMQMVMNRTSELDELSTSITSSLNDAITSMARNIRG